MKCIDTTISLVNRLQQQHIAHISKRSLADNSDMTINFSKKRPSEAKAKRGNSKEVAAAKRRSKETEAKRQKQRKQRNRNKGTESMEHYGQHRSQITQTTIDQRMTNGIRTHQ